jgi:hypothetical protein
MVATYILQRVIKSHAFSKRCLGILTSSSPLSNSTTKYQDQEAPEKKKFKKILPPYLLCTIAKK